MLISVQRLDLAILGFQILHNWNIKIWKINSKKSSKDFFPSFFEIYIKKCSWCVIFMLVALLQHDLDIFL